jgi:hypothetical protein
MIRREADVREPQSNTVGRKQIKNGAINKTKLAAGAVDASKVVRGSLTGADINLSTLGTVPAATTATSAAIARVVIVTATGTNAAATNTGGTAGAATVTCPTGTVVLGGGIHLSDQIAQITNDSYPSATSSWTGDVFNGGFGTPTFSVYAICGPAAATS